MNTLWYKLKFAVMEDIEKLTDKKKSTHAADVLNETIQEAEQQIKAVGKLMDRQRLLCDEIIKEQVEAEKMTAKRKEQLRLAETTEDAELIRYATEEVEHYEHRRDALQNLSDETADSIIQLERRFETMKHQVKDMRVRRLQLMGTENANRAHSRMDQIFEASQPKHSDGVVQKNEEEAEEVNTMRQRLEKLSLEKQTM